MTYPLMTESLVMGATSYELPFDYANDDYEEWECV
jgi:hypothetical protein